jgi:hypothetical protein
VQAVKKIGIREIRADALRELANEGPVAITDNRELVGIFCPVTQDWLGHVLTMNSSRLAESLPMGEKALAERGDDLPTLDDIEARSSLTDESSGGWNLNPFDAVSGVVTAVMARTGMARTGLLDRPQHKTVGVAELKHGETIRGAAHHQQILAVTDRRELIGMIIPVDERFLSHALEANMSRIHASILKGNQELQGGRGRLLDELADEAEAAGGTATAKA